MIEIFFEKIYCSDQFCDKIQNIQLNLNRCQKLQSIISISLFLLGYYNENSWDNVKKSLERPPLNTSGKYFKLYLPNDIVIREN